MLTALLQVLTLAVFIGVLFWGHSFVKRLLDAQKSPIIVDPTLAPKLADIADKIERIGQFEASPVIITDTDSIKKIIVALTDLTAAYKELSEKKLEVRQTVQTPDGVDLVEMQLVLMQLKDDIPELRARFDEFERLMLQIRGR